MVKFKIGFSYPSFSPVRMERYKNVLIIARTKNKLWLLIDNRVKTIDVIVVDSTEYIFPFKDSFTGFLVSSRRFI